MENIVVSANIQFRGNGFKSEYVEFFKAGKGNYIIQIGGSVSGINIFLSSSAKAEEFVNKIINDIKIVEAEEIMEVKRDKV